MPAHHIPHFVSFVAAVQHYTVYGYKLAEIMAMYMADKFTITK